MSSYQQFAELTMTDTGTGHRGFGNPSYDLTVSTNSDGPDTNVTNASTNITTSCQPNGKQLTRSNSIEADPNHIEVIKYKEFMSLKTH